MGKLRQASTFKLAEMFTHRVQLMNGGAGFHKLAGDVLFGGERQSFDGSRQQRRGSAGDQADHQVAWTCGTRQIQNAAGALDAPLIRNRVPAGMCRYTAQAPRCSVRDIDRARRDSPVEQGFDGTRHRHAGFTTPKHVDILELRNRVPSPGDREHASIELDVRQHCAHGIGGVQ